MRLIDGDALKRKAQKVATESWKMKIKANVETILNQFIDWIDAAPTIMNEISSDGTLTVTVPNGTHVGRVLVQEDGTQYGGLFYPDEDRKRGKWIQNDNGTYSCCLCQSWIPEEQYHYARFCLHCGAVMEGEQDG